MLVFRKKEGREGESLAEGATGTEGQMGCGGLYRVVESVTEVCAWMGVTGAERGGGRSVGNRSF